MPCCPAGVFRTVMVRTPDQPEDAHHEHSRSSNDHETITPSVDTATVTPAPVVALKRRTIDSILIGFGVVAAVAFVVAGGLLTWGHNFSSDYVTKELSSQNITFPSAEELNAQGRTDLVKFADQRLDTGAEAEAYASFINGHLEGIAGGATYADLGATESAAKADVKAAVAAGEPQASRRRTPGQGRRHHRTAQQSVQG